MSNTILFSEEQKKYVEDYFQNNPTATKLSRKNSGDLDIPYSVVKLGNNLYVLDQKEKNSNEESKVLGKGAFGKVIIGTKLDDGEQVALKFIKQDLITEEGQQEIEVGKRLGLIIDAPEEVIQSEKEGAKANQVIAMALGGESLGEKLYHGNVTTDQTRLNIGIAFLEKLDDIHSKNVLHLDIKPENILVRDNKDDITVDIIDFGKSIILEQNKQETKKSNYEAFTPKYSPADYKRDNYTYNAASDVYSAGIVIADLFADSNSRYHSLEDASHTNPNRTHQLAMSVYKGMTENDPTLRLSAKESATMLKEIKKFDTMPEGIEKDKKYNEIESEILSIKEKKFDQSVFNSTTKRDEAKTQGESIYKNVMDRAERERNSFETLDEKSKSQNTAIIKKDRQHALDAYNSSATLMNTLESVSKGEYPSIQQNNALKKYESTLRDKQDPKINKFLDIYLSNEYQSGLLRSNAPTYSDPTYQNIHDQRQIVHELRQEASRLSKNGHTGTAKIFEKSAKELSDMNNEKYRAHAEGKLNDLSLKISEHHKVSHPIKTIIRKALNKIKEVSGHSKETFQNPGEKKATLLFQYNANRNKPPKHDLSNKTEQTTAPEQPRRPRNN